MFHHFYTSLNSLLLLLSQVLANIGASNNSYISIIFLTWLNHLSLKITHHFIWFTCNWIHYGRLSFASLIPEKGGGEVRENMTKLQRMIHPPFDQLHLSQCFVGEDTIVISHKHFCPLIFQCIGRERIKSGNKTP